MRNGMLTGLFIVFFLVTGCVGTSPTDLKTSVDSSGMNKADQFIKNGFEVRPGSSRKKIIQNMGTPLSIHAEKAKKPGMSEESKDEIYELGYEGLTITIYRADHENEERLQHISLTSNAYKVKWGLDIGCSKNTVLAVLGKPSNEDESSYTYKPRSGIDSSVHFFFRNDFVYKIDWSYPID